MSRQEIVVKDQGKIEVVAGNEKIALGVENPCCTCAAPIFFLDLAQARELRSALTNAIVQLVENQAVCYDPIAKEAG
jgi:hypothetical protein